MASSAWEAIARPRPEEGAAATRRAGEADSPEGVFPPMGRAAAPYRCGAFLHTPRADGLAPGPARARCARARIRGAAHQRRSSPAPGGTPARSNAAGWLRIARLAGTSRAWGSGTSPTEQPLSVRDQPLPLGMPAADDFCVPPPPRALDLAARLVGQPFPIDARCPGEAVVGLARAASPRREWIVPASQGWSRRWAGAGAKKGKPRPAEKRADKREPGRFCGCGFRTKSLTTPAPDETPSNVGETPWPLERPWKRPAGRATQLSDNADEAAGRGHNRRRVEALTSRWRRNEELHSAQRLVARSQVRGRRADGAGQKTTGVLDALEAKPQPSRPGDDLLAHAREAVERLGDRQEARRRRVRRRHEDGAERAFQRAFRRVAPPRANGRASG